jgi:hypothetical protein
MEGSGGTAPIFLTSALHGGERSVSRSGRYTSVTNFIGDMVGL